MAKKNTRSLSWAEHVDAWRVVPRLMLLAYGALVANLYLWFKSIPTFIQERCDVATLQMLLERKIDLEQAKNIACTVADVVGGPTSAQSAFVTTIVGLSAGIFGMYTATGRKWDGGSQNNQNQFQDYQYNNQNQYDNQNYQQNNQNLYNNQSPQDYSGRPNINQDVNGKVDTGPKM
jgi:hypothetical protein